MEAAKKDEDASVERDIKKEIVYMGLGKVGNVDPSSQETEGNEEESGGNGLKTIVYTSCREI